MKHFYFSIFRKDYAYQGLLLYQSLKKWDSDFHLYIFYFHEDVKEFYEKLNLKDASLIHLTGLAGAGCARPRDWEPESGDRDFRESFREAKDFACLHLLKQYPEIEHLVWLDGDIFCGAGPGPPHKKLGSATQGT